MHRNQIKVYYKTTFKNKNTRLHLQYITFIELNITISLEATIK